MINTIIFDVDGTLIDSSPGVKIAVKKTIERYKLQSLTNNELQIFISTSPIQKAFIKFCHVDEATAQKSADEYRRNYINGDLYNAAAYKNIMELLKYLRNKNYKIGIASYKRQDTLDKILSHFELDKYFDAIHGADNNNKLTKKDLINNCLSDLNTRPEETIFIGDSASDGIAAAEAGCQFIAVTYGFGFKNSNDTARFNPLLTVNNVDEIIKFFKLIQ